jgi:hypothetical protein
VIHERCDASRFRDLGAEGQASEALLHGLRLEAAEF